MECCTVSNPPAKRLVLRIIKLEKALVIQILAQEGIKPVEGGRVWISCNPELCDDIIILRGSNTNKDFLPMARAFTSNKARDKYLDYVINTITNELFTGNSCELKYGEPCLVRDKKYEDWIRLTFVAKSPVAVEDGKNYVVVGSRNNSLFTFKYAKPLTKRTMPVIDGDVYTWEMEVSE